MHEMRDEDGAMQESSAPHRLSLDMADMMKSERLLAAVGGIDEGSGATNATSWHDAAIGIHRLVLLKLQSVSGGGVERQ